MCRGDTVALLEGTFGLSQQRSIVIPLETCLSFPLGSNCATLPSFSFSSFLHLNPPAGRHQVPGEGDGTTETPGFVLSLDLNLRNP